jgi:hypothetical protein
MIIRMTEKLARKLGEARERGRALEANPYLDWTARLFTAERAQYILFTNTCSLFSVVIHGAGVCDLNALMNRSLAQLSDVMRSSGLELIYGRTIAPGTASLVVATAHSKAVTGSMNDLVNHAQGYLQDGEMSPWMLCARLNEIPMSMLSMSSPAEIFRTMRIPE